jgi:TRAP-type C4-dicarboxylate transport system permease small subunit
MSWLRKLLDFALKAMCLFLLGALTTVVLYATVMRYLGRSPSWYDEVASILLCWLTYYAAAFAALNRDHMGFSAFMLALPRPGRITVFVFSEALVFAFFALAALYGWWVLDVLIYDRMISLPSVSIAFTQSVIPTGATLILLAQLASLPKAWRDAYEGIDREHEVIEEVIAEAVQENAEAVAAGGGNS